MIRKGGLLSFCVFVSVAAVLAGCTEDPILADNSETTPGVSIPTIEIVLEAAELPSWRDTTYWGFVLPSSASFNLSADREDLQARPLARFSTIPDSAFIDTLRVAIDSFTAAAIRLSFDTVLSVVPDEVVEIAAWSLARSFDAGEATWQRARAGEPWSTPGGDLETLLGVDSLSLEADTLGVVADSVLIRLEGNVDSLLTAWREVEGEPGFAIVLTGPGGEIRVNAISLLAEAVPEGVDTVLSVVRRANPSTFIFDPLTPETTTRLRLAGLPSARYYLDFELPDSLGFIQLRGSTINRATLEFRPTAAPADPFALDANISAQAVRLLADPFVFGEKTPIGDPLGNLEPLTSDSLASGATMKYDITRLVQIWTQWPPDSIFPLRVGIVPLPESQNLGFWEFYSRDDAPGLRPVVRLLFTPNPSFLLP